MSGRCADYLEMVRALRSANVRTSAILSFPLRRRWNGTNQLRLKSGLTCASPRGEPLLHIFREIFVERRYAPDGLQLPARPTVVDVGAHVGVFALWIVSQAPDARIVCVEPSPQMCSWLRRNLAGNRIGNVAVVEAACAGADRDAVLYARGQAAMNTLFRRDVLGSAFRAAARPQAITLDDLYRQHNITRCDLLKLDCEGAEYEVLYAASPDTLGRTDSITMEYHVGLNEHDPATLSGFLESRGFSVTCTPLLDPEGGYLYARRSR